MGDDNGVVTEELEDEVDVVEEAIVDGWIVGSL